MLSSDNVLVINREIVSLWGDVVVFDGTVFLRRDVVKQSFYWTRIRRIYIYFGICIASSLLVLSKYVNNNDKKSIHDAF